MSSSSIFASSRSLLFVLLSSILVSLVAEGNEPAAGGSTVSATEVKDHSIRYFHTCISKIDDTPVDESQDCLSFSDRKIDIAAGQHIVTGNFVVDSAYGTIGIHVPIPAQLTADESYRLEGKWAGSSKVQLWLTDAKGTPASPVVERFLPIIGTTLFQVNSSELTAPEKHRLFVIEQFDTRFGDNLALFESRFRALADSCGIAIDFAMSEAVEDLNRRVSAFGPDGILFVNAKPDLSHGSATASNATIYGINTTLTDGQAQNRQWAAKLKQPVFVQRGGDDLATDVVLRFSEMGVLPHCPAIEQPRPYWLANQDVMVFHCHKVFGPGVSNVSRFCVDPESGSTFKPPLTMP